MLYCLWCVDRLLPSSPRGQTWIMTSGCGTTSWSGTQATSSLMDQFLEIQLPWRLQRWDGKLYCNSFDCHRHHKSILLTYWLKHVTSTNKNKESNWFIQDFFVASWVFLIIIGIYSIYYLFIINCVWVVLWRCNLYFGTFGAKQIISWSKMAISWVNNQYLPKPSLTTFGTNW